MYTGLVAAKGRVSGIESTEAGSRIRIDRCGWTHEPDRGDSIAVNGVCLTVVELTGHTDSTGSAAYNQTLSEQRAATVATYLNTRGIDRQRILAFGRGLTQPVADNATAEGRALNRRVEIRLSPITG